MGYAAPHRRLMPIRGRAPCGYICQEFIGYTSPQDPVEKMMDAMTTPPYELVDPIDDGVLALCIPTYE